MLGDSPFTVCKQIIKRSKMKRFRKSFRISSANGLAFIRAFLFYILNSSIMRYSTLRKHFDNNTNNFGESRLFFLCALYPVDIKIFVRFAGHIWDFFVTQPIYARDLQSHEVVFFLFLFCSLVFQPFRRSRIWNIPPFH